MVVNAKILGDFQTMCMRKGASADDNLSLVGNQKNLVSSQTNDSAIFPVGKCRCCTFIINVMEN